MIDWWSENGPPVYVSVAGYLGLIKKKAKPKKSENLNELFSMMGAGGILN